jgi:uncharacterized protein YqjF (DUF2071 family)
MFWSPADVRDALRQPRAAFAESAHRPWPLPGGPWVMGQTWNDLLFAHWRVDPDALRRIVPEQIPLDTFDGSAWIAVTPFVVTGARPRLALPFPGMARFPEINVRTYATIDGKPGIWFLSLDTPNAIVNEAARRAYRVPYFRSRIEVRRDDDRIRYRAERSQQDAPSAGIDIDYAPTGPVYEAAPGSFEHFACERYCLYTLDDRKRVLRGEIHHPPWPLQPADAEIAWNRMGDEAGVALEGEPTLHYARRQDVVFWLNQPVGRG